MMKLAPTIAAVAILALLTAALLAWFDVSRGESAQAPQLAEASTRASQGSSTVNSPLEPLEDVRTAEAAIERTETRASLREASSVRVHVQWERSGGPAPDVTVRCQSLWGARRGDIDRRTDANGVVEFEGLSSGPIKLETEFGGGATAVTPRNGRVDVELLVPDTVAVLGHVVDTRKQPVPRAVIWGAPFGMWTPIATCDASGYFRLARGSQGEYLAASTPDGALGRTRRVPSEGLSEYSLDLVAGGEGRRIVGRVVDERDTPLADVLVVVDLKKGLFGLKPGRMSRSDHDGRFVLGNLSPSTHELRLSLAPFASLEEKIHLEPPEDFEHVWRLSPGIVFTGTVRRNGEPQPGALVFVGDIFTSPHNSAVTDASGAFRLSGLSPGEQTAAAACAFKDGVPCDLFDENESDDAELWATEATIEFQDAQTAVFHFELELKVDGEAQTGEAAVDSPASDQR